MSRFTASLVFAVIVSVGGVVNAQSTSGGGSRPQPQTIPGQFIVELHPGHSKDAVMQGHGLTALERWDIVNGFVARMSDVAVSRLRADARVKLVAPDVVVNAFPRAPGGGKGGKGGGGVPPTCPSPSAAMSVSPVIPTGVGRIGGASAPVGDVTKVNVAIIDTGIDDCHPDLHVGGGVNILDSTKSPRDDNGHGTHVAGIVGALRNDFGVVGVAPGASLYAVKVLDASGSGSLSNVVTALNWAVNNGMKVANLSLGALDFLCSILGPAYCGQGTECTAISNAVAAGVTVIVAAGNSADDALYYTPASCRDSLTVSAFADSDGAPGGHGPLLTVNNQQEVDDTFAQTFSNHSQYYWDMNGNGIVDAADHPVIDLMAPGVAILSTMPTYTVTLNTQYAIPLNYGELTGTSMSTPHVTGAAARYLAAHPGATADQVRLGLVAAGECHDGETPALICSSKWPDDPDPDPSEPLVRILGF